MILIDIFESGEQTVKRFNKIFKTTKLSGFCDSESVEIGEITAGDKRILTIGKATVLMDLTQRKSEKRSYAKKAETNGRKICTLCGVLKSFTEFSPQKTAKYGLNPRCKPCNVKKSLEWRSRNKERFNEAQNKRYAERKGKL